jgi:O-antigen/teichoic acid export membrane protein
MPGDSSCDHDQNEIVSARAMKAINNALWLSISRILADVLSFVLFVAIARDFGPAGTGEYSYAFAIGALVALAAGSGLEEFGIREYVRSSGAARTTIWTSLLTAQCAQLAIALSGFVLYLLLDHDRAASLPILLELMFFQVALTLSRNLFVPAMAAQAMGTPALLELTCRVGATVIALVLILRRTPIALSIALLSFPIAGAVLIALAYRNSASHGATWRIDPRWSVLRDTWKRTAHFAGSETLNQFYARTDLLLIAYFLGQEHVGLYATDIKFVEVGIVPLVYIGVAVYPILVAIADGPAAEFLSAARDFCRVQLTLLPWFALFAVVKGCEIALYRLLYSVRRQSVYFRSLAVGTVVIAALNVLLIPRSGVLGAIHATVLSTACVVVINAVGLANRIPWRVFGVLLLRLAAALALTWALVIALEALGAAPWLQTVLGCCLYPAIAALVGLLPNPGRSSLFARQHSVPATS